MKHSYRDPPDVAIDPAMAIIDAKMAAKQVLGPDWRIGYKIFRAFPNDEALLSVYASWKPPNSIFPTWTNNEWRPGKIISIPRTKALCWCKADPHNPDEISYTWRDDTWHHCPPDHPAAVAYWDGFF